MIIENGDLFVVVRGFQFGRVYSGFGEEPGEPTFDRSYNSQVFRALNVEGFSIVAERVSGGSEYSCPVGERILLNSSELVLETVTENHLKLLNGGKPVKKGH